MKHILPLLLFISSTVAAQETLPVNSKTGKVNYSHVIELDSSYTSTTIFSIAKKWILSDQRSFSISNSEKHGSAGNAMVNTRSGMADLDMLFKQNTNLLYEDKGDGVITGQGLFKYTGSSMGLIRILYIPYKVNIYVKDHRTKIEVTDLTYAHYNQMTGKQVQISGLRDEGPCASRGEIENLLECKPDSKAFQEFFGSVNSVMDSVIDNYRAALKKKSSSSDW